MSAYSSLVLCVDVCNPPVRDMIAIDKGLCAPLCSAIGPPPPSPLDPEPPPPQQQQQRPAWIVAQWVMRGES